jgi:hypothetical protein
MHHLLSLKAKIWIIFGLASVVAAISSKLFPNALLLGAVVGAVEIFVIVLLLHSWRWTTKARFIPRPRWMSVDLTGRWNGKIYSQWQNDKNIDAVEPIATTLDVKQTWREVVFSLHTDQMRPRSSHAMPNFDPITNELQFRYFFETLPNAASSIANPPQRLGSAIAIVNLDSPNKMEIIYTNERGIGGNIALRRSRSSTTVSS